MDIDALCRRGHELKNGRTNWDTLFQEIAERVWPSMADFSTQQSPGAKRTEKMFDPTASLAAQKAVAAIAAFAWPANQRYQRLTTNNPALNKSQRVKVWFDNLTEKLFQARYSPRASFAAQMDEAALSSFIFGTGPMFIDEDIKRQTLRYKALHLGQTYVAEGPDGRIDTVYRCWHWSLRQVDKRWPGKLPPKLAEKLAKNPEELIEVSHLVSPRTDYDPGRLGAGGLPWASFYWLPSEKHMLDEGGFHEWPFGIHRYMTSTGEVYGRSPAWLALSSIKVLNEQKKTILKAAHKAADPPLLAALDADGVLSAFSQVPGAVNHGGLDDQGNALVKPLLTGARIDIGLDMMDREREIISGAFMMDVFRVLVENPNMTATQTLELLNERATIMSPIVGRYESEHFDPQTEREIGLLMRAGQLDPMPDELVEAQGEYKIEYTSPMRKAMRATDAIAISRSIEQITPLAQIDPTVMRAIRAKETLQELWEINGAPAKLLRSADEIAALEQEESDAAAASQLLEAAPAVSQTAANLARMQAAGGVMPGLGG